MKNVRGCWVTVGQTGNSPHSFLLPARGQVLAIVLPWLRILKGELCTADAPHGQTSHIPSNPWGGWVILGSADSPGTAVYSLVFGLAGGCG